MKKILKKREGITLIALVITIIVLVILAGVAISSLVGTNGIITRAKQAKSNTKDAVEDEATALKGYEDYIEKEIKSEPVIISFTLEGTSYNCEEGTTWNELVNEGIIPTKYSIGSDVYDYDSSNAYYSVVGGVIIFSGGGEDQGYGTCFVFAPDEYAVLGNDEVINGGNYTDAEYGENSGPNGVPASCIRPGVGLTAK